MTDDNNKALEAVKVIREKIGGIIKVRTCANWSNKWKYVKEGKIVALPTVSLESLFKILTNDAM